MTQFVSVVFQGFIILVVIQSILWVIQLKTKDASTADIGWCLGILFLFGWYVWQMKGLSLSSGILLLMVSIWALRLSSHLLLRLLSHKQEDSRYAQLRQVWGEKANRNFLFVFLIQPIFDVILSVPFLIVCLNPAMEMEFLHWLAIVVWLIGFIGEVIADQQLRHFVSKPENKGQICQVGLWNHSRHPNFFFEWVMWVSYMVFAFPYPQGWLAIVAPALMLFLLLKVTGVPFMEERALKRKGDAFRRYMQTTSMFIPLPKKS